MIERLRIMLGWRSAGFVLVVLTAGLGLAVHEVSTVGGAVVQTLAALMLVGAITAKLIDWRSPPPPGQLVTANGRRVHLLAEGEAGAMHPVIWVPGGHGAGLIMNHLHKVFRQETRSILIDRTGSGWSDPARGIVTFSQEVRQLRDALELTGEEGPFVIAGHSFGGLFSANFAHHYPELVAGVVLLDSTPPWNVAFAGHLSFNTVKRKAWWGALATHFGLHRFVEPEIDDPDSALARELADVAKTVNWHSVQPKSLLAEASIFQASMDNPFDLVIGEGALGTIPLLLMVTDETEEFRRQVRDVIKQELGLSEKQLDNFMDGLHDSVRQQLALSSNSRLHVMPPDATHMFPYEYPEIVCDAVRPLLQRSA